jgi:hypothetical protein
LFPNLVSPQAAPETIKRGMIETEFMPKRGTINNAPIPDTPLRTPPAQTKMPVKTGAAIEFGPLVDAAAQIGELLGQWALTYGTTQLDPAEAAMLFEDMALAQCFVQGLQTATRTIVETKVKKKREKDKPDSAKRTRIIAYSRSPVKATYARR